MPITLQKQHINTWIFILELADAASEPCEHWVRWDTRRDDASIVLMAGSLCCFNFPVRFWKKALLLHFLVHGLLSVWKYSGGGWHHDQAYLAMPKCHVTASNGRLESPSVVKCIAMALYIFGRVQDGDMPWQGRIHLPYPTIPSEKNEMFSENNKYSSDLEWVFGKV